MNINSLAHKFVQNQQPSWIDDPFDLKGAFAGVANMNKKQSIESHAEELVATYATYAGAEYTLTLDMLPSHEQFEFARAYIEFIDREIEWACYGSDESINSDFLCALLEMLKDNNEETRENFAIVTCRNILVYYKKSLNKLLENACTSYTAHDDNEISWGKLA